MKKVCAAIVGAAALSLAFAPAAMAGDGDGHHGHGHHHHHDAKPWVIVVETEETEQDENEAQNGLINLNDSQVLSNINVCHLDINAALAAPILSGNDVGNCTNVIANQDGPSIGDGEEYEDGEE